MARILFVLSTVAVAVASILLVIWLVDRDGFTSLYASMAFAATAIVLVGVANRWARKACSGRTPADAEVVTEPASSAEPGQDRFAGAVARDGAPAGELRPFPVAGYDTLWVSQIVERVAGLDDVDLAAVEVREREGRCRPAVLEAVARARPSAPTAPAGAAVATHPAASDAEAVQPAATDEELWVDTAPAVDGEAPAGAAVATEPVAPDPAALPVDVTDEELWVDTAPAVEGEAPAGRTRRQTRGSLPDGERLP